MQHFSLTWLCVRRSSATAIAKKNASAHAGIGILFLKEQTFFKEKSRLT